jgi:hypothetical protein
MILTVETPVATLNRTSPEAKRDCRFRLGSSKQLKCGEFKKTQANRTGNPDFRVKVLFYWPRFAKKPFSGNGFLAKRGQMAALHGRYTGW